MFPHMSVEKRLLSREAGFPLHLRGASARDKMLMEGLMWGGGGTVKYCT